MVVSNFVSFQQFERLMCWKLRVAMSTIYIYKCVLLNFVLDRNKIVLLGLKY